MEQEVERNMMLTEELKGKLESAKDANEAGEILNTARKNVEAAGIILDDADLEQVTGGVKTGMPVAIFKPLR